jgi:hypothetical protein
MQSTRYYVWRRNDGYINATCYPVADWVGANGEVTSFVSLGVFDVWADAAATIRVARAEVSQ